MADSISVSPNLDRQGRYQELIPQIAALICGEEDIVANMANIAAALKEAFKFLWVGFYLVKGDELVLGPFQGPVACTRIQKGKGVCGTAWQQKRSIIVPDVDQFPGHIACSTFSKSEIVVPLIVDDEVLMVLDVDSEEKDSFSKIDAHFLGKILSKLESIQ
jgi:L-methionine (R)-S-oxide reductase